MNIAVAERSATERELSIEIPGEQLSTLIEGKIDSVRKRIALPGFRAGKVPKDVVRKRFGESIRGEALEELVNQVLRSAFKEKDIKPVAPGQVEHLDAPEGGDIKLKAVVEVDPEIDLKDYQNLGIAIETSSVADAQLDEHMESIRQRLAEVKKPERPSQKGDLVTARYTKILVEGVEKPAPVPSFQAEIGKGIPEVDKALTGVNPGQEVSIDFVFPADYADAEQAGKKARYEVVVEAVFERILPDFTDELAAKVGPFKTMDEFKARVRADLEEEARQTARRAAHEQAVDAVLARNPFAVPKARVAHFVEWQRDRMARMGHQTPSLEEMLAMMGSEAEKAVRRQRVVEWIFEKEGIKATTEEVDARIKEMAEQAGISSQDAREELRKSGRLSEIRENLRFEKTLDWLVGVR